MDLDENGIITYGIVFIITADMKWNIFMKNKPRD